MIPSDMSTPRIPENLSPVTNLTRPNSYSPRISGQNISHLEVSIRGVLDEKNEVIMKAIALEEGVDDDEDIEVELPLRLVVRVYLVKVSLAIILVIVWQTLRISKVGQTLANLLHRAATHTSPDSQPVYVGWGLLPLYLGKTTIPVSGVAKSVLTTSRQIGFIPALALFSSVIYN